MSGFLPGQFSTFNYGNDEPAVDDRSKPWLRTNPDGTFDKVYTFAGGLWVSPHHLPPGARIIAPSTLLTAADVWAWDGGDGTDPSTTTPSYATGAMWEIDPILTARFPLGAGTLPSGAVVAPNATGGAELHTLITAELPAHTHFLAADEVESASSGTGNSIDSATQMVKRRTGGSDLNYNLIQTTTAATVGLTGPTGAATPVNMLPVYGAVIFIQRTNRTQYVP